MADKKQLEASKIDALYSWISYDLQKMKGELLKEMKYSSVQVGSLYQAVQSDKDKSAQAISQEIRYSYKQNQTIYDGLATMLTKEVGERLNSMDESTATISNEQTAIKQAIEAAVESVMQKLEAVEGDVAALENVDVEKLAEKVKESVSDVIAQLEEVVSEAKYSYMQQQAIYDGLTALISGEVVAKLNDVQAKLAVLEQLDNAIAEVNERVAEGIALFEDADYKSVIESVAEKTEESVAEHSRQVLEAVAAIPVAENVDYNRIVDEVGDKVLELLGEVGLGEAAPAPVVVEVPEKPVEVKIDYDKIIYGAAEKVVESLPYPEKVNYRRIDESFEKAAEKVNLQVNVGEDVIAAAVNTAVEKAMSKIMEALDVDALATAVAAKIEVPKAEAVEIDYDLLATMVADKLAASDEQTYDVVLDEAGIDQIAEKVSERLGQIENVDYTRIENIVEEKLTNQPCEEPTYELVVDEEGVQAIAKSVSEELCKCCKTCEEAASTQAPVEEVVETVEEVVEEVVEEAVEETVEAVESPVEEAVEVVEETQVSEELAVAAEPVAESAEAVLEEVDNQLVDAETGLVIRLKKSFTAKMKQSDEKVKEYYSDIKNELTSYKKINSNVSWHGDRFNFGRDTVAKVNICGKTLCFYLALDPENPEYKTTVYHQKNVGAQKAYENTPFMVKVKSDAAAKKALRLVGYLADKLGAVKENGFEPVNYAEEFAYETTKQLFDAGYIKATKEKKVDLDF
ncbi:MAG: hypothetical protein J6B56_01270 [Clostridia bacterium]|nr:hypothetical protein [Clostridia bacterium]